MNTKTSILVSVRLSPRTAETLDKMVSDGNAINRSDAMRIVLDRSLGETETVE